MLHVWSNTPTRSTSSLARLITRCACFVMVTYTCYHKPVGLHNIVIEHGVGTQLFRSNLCSGFDLVSFPLGCTSVPGLELGTRLWFVDWITDEIVPLSQQNHLLEKQHWGNFQRWWAIWKCPPWEARESTTNASVCHWADWCWSSTEDSRAALQPKNFWKVRSSLTVAWGFSGFHPHASHAFCMRSSELGLVGCCRFRCSDWSSMISWFNQSILCIQLARARLQLNDLLLDEEIYWWCKRSVI